MLYQVMQEHLATFLARTEAGAAGPGLPRHVRRELAKFLDCGVLARGFCRVVCDTCKQSSLVAYSCKARAVCPSCTGRRMAELAAHLADTVFPEAPVRQWVLSLPLRVRYLLARHPNLCREVRGIFARAVHSFYQRRAQAQGVPKGRCGSVVHVQRFDSAIRLYPHFHGLFLDGVFTGFDTPGPLTFHPASALTDDDVAWMARHLAALISGRLRRLGYLSDAGEILEEPDLEPSALATCHAAAVQGRIPFGDRAGRRENLFGYSLDQPPPPRPSKELCAEHDGYSLHAAVRTGARQRARLERLARYVARPPFSQDRLSVSRDGSVVYRFRRPWRNGKEAVVLDPMTFLSRLAAQVPPPRFHMVSYYGVLAPAASRRDEIVPGHGDDEQAAQPCRGASDERPALDARKRPRRRPERLPWAELARRVFLAEVLQCQCGGRRRVLAMIFDPTAIERILRHLGIPHLAPTRAPPRPMPARLPFTA